MAVGSIYVDVRPSTRGFVGEMANDLEREGDKLGKDLGRRIADGVGKNLAREITDGLPQLTDFQKVGDAAEAAGKKAGKRFSQGMINEARQLTADLRNLTSAETTIKSRLEINTSALDEVQREIHEIGNNRINVDVDVDDVELNYLAEKLKLEDYHLRVKIDTDEGKLPQIQKDLHEVQGLARDMPALHFDADYHEIDEAGRSVEKLGQAAKETDRAGQRLNKFQEYGLLATAAFTPASAAVLGLAAAGLAVIAPIAAIAAGIEGIKLAVAPLNTDLQALRSNVSAAFIEGLAPAVSNLKTIFPALNTGLTGTASALSGVAVHMTEVASSSRGISLINDVFANMNEAITGLGPPMGTLTDNTLRFADIGASALVVVGPILDQVGAAWTSMLDTLVDTGQGRDAVVALVQVLGSLLTLAAPLVQLGAEMFAAIGPGLAAAISGAASVVSVLANAFAALPGPLQTALGFILLLRAALAFSGKTLGGIVSQIGQFASKVNDGLTAPFRSASSAMSAYDARAKGTGEQLTLFGTQAEKAGKQTEDAGHKVAATATAGDKVAGSFRIAGEAIGMSYVTGVAKATASLDRFQTAPARAAAAVGDFADRTQARLNSWADATNNGIDRVARGYDVLKTAPAAALQSMQVGYNRATIAGEDFANRGSAALDRVKFGFYDLQGAPRAALDSMQGGLLRSADSAGQWASRSTESVSRVRSGFTGLAAGPMASIQLLSTGMSQGGFQFQNYASQAESGGGRVRAAFSALGGIVTSSLSTATTAVTSGASRMTTALGTGVDQAVTRVGKGYITLGEVVGKGMDGATRAVSTGATAIGAGLTGLTGAATRAGAGIASGFGKAISGISFALGGVWGIAIMGAMVLLSLFGDKMSQNAQKSAEFQQSVHKTADTLRESAGAITSNMRETELLGQIQAGSGVAAQTLGLNLQQLTSSAMAGGAGFQGLMDKLQQTARAGDAMTYASYELGGGMDAAGAATIAQGEAAQTLITNLGPLAEKYRQAKVENDAFAAAIGQSGNSMVMGLASAAQLTAAFGQLSSEMSTVEERAKGLAAALTLLTGGTLPAEAAAAQFGQAMDQVGEKMTAAKSAAAGAGVGILDAAGNINRATPAGKELVIAMAGVSTSMSQAAASAFDSAGGFNNLQAAGSAAFGVVQQGRGDFIKMAEGAGIGTAAANRYADQMGLIPELVVSLLSIRSEGMPQVQQELFQVKGLVAGAAVGAVVPITVSGDALNQLKVVGAEIVSLPEGKIGIKVNDQTAPQIDSILRSIGLLSPQTGPLKAGDTVAIPKAATDAAGSVNPQTGAFVPGPTGGIPAAANSAAAGTSPQTGPFTPGSTAPLTQGVQGAVAGLGPQEIQVVLGNVQEIENTINRIRQNLANPITMTLIVNDAAVGAIEATKAKAAAPVTFSFDATDVAFGRIAATKASAAEAVVFTFDATDVAFGRINATKQAAAEAVVFTFDAVDVAFGRINATKAAASTPVTFLFDATDVAVGRIAATKAGASASVSFVFDCVDVAVGRMAATKASGAAPVTFVYDANDVAIGRINATKAIGSAPVTFSFDANDVAIGRINATKAVATRAETFPFDVIDNAIGKVNSTHEAARRPESFTLTISNAGTISSQLDSIAHDRTVTYRIVTVGAPPPPGNALGNVYGFAKGGFNGLTPMTGGRAKLVQPNTWRVVGDRQSKPEAYIPIDNAPRSRALLSYTAKAMGFALQPMAQGGFGSNETLRLAQLAQQKIGTQSVGSMQAVRPIAGGDGKDSDQTRQLAEIATLLKEQAAAPRTITVEDRSGNPVETARASNLAFRMSR